MILKLVFENTINFCAYFVIFLCFYNCKFLSMDLIIATYNIAGLGNDIKRKSMWQFFKTNKFDIIFLQETNSSPKKKSKFISEKIKDVGNGMRRQNYLEPQYNNK